MSVLGSWVVEFQVAVGQTQGEHVALQRYECKVLVKNFGDTLGTQALDSTCETQCLVNCMCVELIPARVLATSALAAGHVKLICRA